MEKYILAVCLYVCCLNVGQTTQHRSKRFLTFPRTSPTRLQLIVGIGIPVQLKIESVTIGWVNKVEFFLPENASNYLGFLRDPFDLTTRPNYGFYDKRAIDDGDSVHLWKEASPTEAPGTFLNCEDPNEPHEMHQADVEIDEKPITNEIDAENGSEDEDNEDDEDDDDDELNTYGMSEADYWNQEDDAKWHEDHFKPKAPKDLSKFRWGVYKTMAVFAESRGLPGKMCVLRSICESAHTPFGYTNGILGELAHILMTPSMTIDDIHDPTDNEYFYAEKFGKEGGSCEHEFGECSESILDQFSGVYSPLLDLFGSIDN